MAIKDTGLLSRLYNIWLLFRESLWLVPAFISLLYSLLILLSYWAELFYFADLKLPALVFNGESGDASEITTTLLSSMITMATLAISITVVSLSLAASQLGPRLIRTFMADRRTQVFIGLFFGAVTACFVLTALLHHATEDAFTPKLTVSLVFLICFGNLFVLLMFVHHVAQSCIADNVINKVSGEFLHSIDRLAEEKTIARTTDEDQHAHPQWPENFTAISAPLALNDSGYIQFIDYRRMTELARRYHCRVEVPVKPGHFVVHGEPCLLITPVTLLDDDARHEFITTFELGNSQTQTQDIQFAMRHLVEIAIRALSPGINDSFTALTVIDHLSDGIARLFHKNTASEWMMDSEGDLRVRAKQCDASDIVFSALTQIRESAEGNPSVLAHLMDKLVILADLAHQPSQISGINRQWQNLGALLDKLDPKVPRERQLQQQFAEISKNSPRLQSE